MSRGLVITALIGTMIGVWVPRDLERVAGISDRGGDAVGLPRLDGGGLRLAD